MADTHTRQKAEHVYPEICKSQGEDCQHTIHQPALTLDRNKVISSEGFSAHWAPGIFEQGLLDQRPLEQVATRSTDYWVRGDQSADATKHCKGFYRAGE